MALPSGAAAIAGIGHTEFSKSSGRSELQLAAEAVRAAIVDAGPRAGRHRRLGHVCPGHQRRAATHTHRRHP